MRRGTRVGEAYVAITADGSGLNEDIVDSVDEAGDAIEESGSEHGEGYGDNFGEGMSDSMRRSQENVARGLSERMEQAGTDGGDRAGRAAGDRMAERLRETLDGNPLSAPDESRQAADRLRMRAGEVVSLTAINNERERGLDLSDEERESLARTTARLEEMSQARLADRNARNGDADDVRVREAGEARINDLRAQGITMTERMEARFRSLAEGMERDREADAAAGDARRRRNQDELSDASGLLRMRREMHEIEERAAALAGRGGDRRSLGYQMAAGRRTADAEYAEELRVRIAAAIEAGGDEGGAAMSDRINEHAAEAGDRAGSTMTERMTESVTSNETSEWDAYWERTGNDAGESMGDGMVDALEDNRDHHRDTVADTFDNDTAERHGDRFGNHFSEAMTERLENGLAGYFDELNNRMDEADERMRSSRVSGNRDRDRTTGDTDNDRFSGRNVGNMFGGNSRIGPLRALGKSIGGIVSLIQAMPKIVGAATGFVKRFSDGMSQAAEGASMMQKMGAGASSAFAGMGSALTGAAVALPAIILALSILVSILGALLGLLVAIAATITSALTAALLVGAGALAAVAAAAGLAAIAFTSMTDAQKEMLSDAFGPVKSMLTGIGQLMLGPMTAAFQTWANNVKAALLPLAGIAERLGQAFAMAGNILTASFSGPGFQAFIAALGTYLPSIITRLSSALGGFLNGMLGLFAAIMPQVNRFAGYLQSVGERFSAWANSAKGRNTIVEWTERAVNSLISLWGATKQVFGFIGDLLFGKDAQNAGNSIFDSIARTFEGLRKNIAKAAANGDLKRWFDDAIQFGAAFWNVLRSIWDVLVSLYDSGVIDAISGTFNVLAGIFDGLRVILDPLIWVLGYVLPPTLALALAPLALLASSVLAVGEAAEWVGGLFGIGNGSEFSSALAPLEAIKDLAMSPFTRGDSAASSQAPKSSPSNYTLPDFVPGNFSIGGLTDMGDRALDATSEKNGGNRPDYVNPYVEYAESLMQQGPTIARQIKEAMAQIGKDVNKAMMEAAKAANAGEARTAIQGVMDSMRSNIKSIVDSARGDLDSAAQSLASAGSEEDANKALKAVSKAQAALTKALTAQRQINLDAKFLAKQKIVSADNVRQLQYGIKVQGATLADFAAARERLTKRIEAANTKLTDAIGMRNDYRNSVTDATRSFAGLLTAEASVIDGVTQALTYGDITKNLQTRLAAIRKFQADLRILVAQGLSDDAYKQLVDGGVEQGGEYAAALVQGGSGAISEVNDLTGKINAAANQLGAVASNRMYQAGVDSAKGLVAGLESMSGQLDRAATRLGNSIARAVKKTLGIKSPSRVMRDTMSYVGDGIEVGLDDQTRKVERAANRLSNRIAVAPTVGAAQAGGLAGPVSGNQPNPAFRDLIVHTPTKDPEAVAIEAVNELVGRL